MIKNSWLLTICSVIILGIPFLTNAAACGPRFGEAEVELPGITKNIDELACSDSPILSYINLLIRFATAAIVLVGLISVVAGGYVYMTAGGDAGRVQKAKTIISSALLGIILALGAFTILNTLSPQFAKELKEPEFGPAPVPPAP